MAAAALLAPSAAAQEPKAPPPLPETVRISPYAAPVPTGPPPAVALARAFDALRKEYVARHPDVALEARWPGAQAVALGTAGSAAFTRWRSVLEDMAAEVVRFDRSAATRVQAARLASLADWCAAERIVLESQALVTRDPASYVQRAARVLAAARDAGWLEDEARTALRLRLLDELPAYLRDARASLTAPAPRWIDHALLDLDELEELVLAAEALRAPSGDARAGETDAPVPPRRRASRETRETPLAALQSFRRWLLELRPAAGGQPPRLGAADWARVVRHDTGVALDPRELKARALRELLRLEHAADDEPGRAEQRADAGEQPGEPGGLAPRAWTAAARALNVGQAARVVRLRASARDLDVIAEEGGRTSTAAASVHAPFGRPTELRIALPSRAWPVERADTRRGMLQGRDLGGVGVRHSLAGEALYERSHRSIRDPLRALLHRPTQRAALGLFALDWLPRVRWVENPFADDPPSSRAFERQLRLEIARLLAALELHAEGVALDEAALAFQRRTGVDGATARAEALAAERDPRHGLGWVGMLELAALEARLAEVTGDARKGLGLTVLIASRHPDLRPADVREAAERAIRLRAGANR